MARRSYEQYCPLASALDVVGERWTLLLIRDLLLGPMRYSDMMRAQPGIGTNLLAKRLKDMQAVGLIVQRELPPPAASTVYELTEKGLALQPVVAALGRWGMDFMPEQELDAADLQEALRHRGELVLLRPVSTAERYALTVDGLTFSIDIAPGHFEVSEGAVDGAVVHARLSLRTFLTLGMRSMTVDEAISRGLVDADGDTAALERLVALLGMPEYVPSEAVPA